MIVQCADCKTRYELDAGRVPQREIRVRCPKCRAVFGIDGRRANEPAPERVAAATPAAHVAPPAQQPVEPTPVVQQAPIEPTPVVEQAPVAQAPVQDLSAGIEIERNGIPNKAAPAPHRAAPEMEFEIERSAGPAVNAARPVANAAAPQAAANLGTAVADAPAKPKANPADDKAKRLARALVSDILVYHRDARDQALADGNLVQVLGQEIKKSWELYKERVTPEVANETNYFREALNEILADGQQIF